MKGSGTAPRARIAFFRAEDAAPVGPDTMVTLPPSEAVRSGLALLERAQVRRGIGEESVVLFKGPAEGGFSLIRLWFKSGYLLPPHSHDGDCLYYVIAGELSIGGRVLRKGDGMHIPAHCGYSYEAGPDGVEILEFRNATRFSIDLRGNIGAWTRIAAIFSERASLWESEKVPPSGRPAT
jgi:hypothetical protein